MFILIFNCTLPMCAYISTVLPPVDRLYLLDELLSNLLAEGTGKTPGHPTSTKPHTEKKKKERTISPDK
jgi:hypothetical protein